MRTTRPGLEALRAAFEGAPNAVLMVDGEGRIVLLNREAEALFGYAREELVGQLVERLVPETAREDHPWHRQQFMTEPAQRRMGGGRDLFALHRDGHEVPVEIGLNPVATDEGTFIITSIIDITLRKAAEHHERVQAQELARLNHDLQRSNEALANMSSRLLTIQDEERARIAYDLHDDFGQLLAILQMNLDVILEELPEDQERLREHAQRSLDQLRQASHSMRTIVKQLRPVPLETLGLVATLEQQVFEFQQQSGLRCELRVDPPDLSLDLARGTMVVRVVQEGLANVLHHANATRVGVELRREGDRGVLVVRDDGSGIASEQQNVGPATSLGLFTVRERARTFGGGLSVRAAPEGGTELCVTFSMEAAAAQ